MLDQTTALLLVLAALVFFATVGFSTRGQEDVDAYLVARSSQGSWRLGLSFLASGMGAWILFAPPEVGAGIGLVAVLGYAVGAAGPILAFALIGPRLRRLYPEGLSITTFVEARFGRTFSLYVGVISVAYMFFFLAAELTAAGAVTSILTGLDGRIVVIAVAIVTLAYTAYGGLRASIRTDSWQAWLIVALVAAALVAIVGDLESPSDAWNQSELLALDRLGLEVAATLVIAVIAANMFHQGYWQRVWAARDDASLRHGALLGALGSMPLVAALGAIGIIAVGAGTDIGAPPVPLFALMTGLPHWVGGVVLLAGVSLVASSVDTLENALASVVVSGRRGVTLGAARIVTVVVMVPAVVVGVQGYSVLRLFLIADLLCAATVAPVLLGLWSRMTTRAAVAGAASGLIGAVTPGIITSGSLVEGIEAATFPGAIPAFPPFLWSLLASTAVSLSVALLAKPRSAPTQAHRS